MEISFLVAHAREQIQNIIALDEKKKKKKEKKKEGKREENENTNCV